jgi:hypothetical protein
MKLNSRSELERNKYIELWMEFFKKAHDSKWVDFLSNIQQKKLSAT